MTEEKKVEEGTQAVEENTSTQTPANEEKTTEGKEEKKKYPESVEWNKYVGVKEQLRKTEEKVSSLEEQLKNAVSGEEYNRTKEELEKVRGTLKEKEEQTLTEKRNNLVNKGISKEKVDNMSVEGLDALEEALKAYKPKPDWGGGSGTTVPVGKPIDLAKQAYNK